MGDMPKFASIQDLRNNVLGGATQEYMDRMYQKIPDDLPTVKDRAAYLVEKSKDKIVLDIGCTGMISQAIRKVAKAYYGIDKVAADGIEACNLDLRPDLMPVHADVDTIICSETLEHLANPGFFLMALRKLYPGRVAYFTVPNAGAYVVKDGCELVNRDHVCWYSYATLRTLFTRYGLEIKESRWYNGQPYNAEGIIAVTQT